jgi:uncharacterized repeat protein (TIGR01451 family)
MIAAVVCLAFAPGAWAVGADAGTRIVNQATVDYTVGTSPPLTAVSGTVGLTVAELVDVDVSWADASTPVPVLGPLPAAWVPLRFAVTNLGNGDEDWDLAADNTLLGDDFDPDASGTSPVIYRDNGDGIFDTGTGDTLVVGSESIAATSVITPIYFFVLNDFSDTSPTGPGDGERAWVSLSATSTNAAGGSVQVGAGDGGSDLVLGTSGGTDGDTGIYEVVLTTLVMIKSAVVDDGGVSPTGDQPIPGATITYTIDLGVQGSGTAVGVVFTDPIPTDTTYVPGTLQLNGAPAGTVSSVPPEAVINLGNLNAASGTQTITFDVTID